MTNQKKYNIFVKENLKKLKAWYKLATKKTDVIERNLTIEAYKRYVYSLDFTQVQKDHLWKKIIAINIFTK